MVAYSFKKRFVPQIRRGLVSAYPDSNGIRPKRQTIRAGSIDGHGEARSPKGKRHSRAGDPVQLYTAMRTKACQKLGDDPRCTGVRAVILWLGIDNKITVMLDGKLLGPRKAAAFVRDDGFESEQDMVEFWRSEHGDVTKFEGVLILWEPTT